MRLRRYGRENAPKIVALAVAFLLVWSGWIGCQNLRIDTGTRILNPRSSMGWLISGRQGGILFDRLFHQHWFNPYFSQLFGYAALFAAAGLLGYALSRWRHGEACWSAYAFVGVIALTHPIMAEVLYFDMMMDHVAWAYLLCVPAVFWTYDGLLNGKKLALTGAVLAQIWAFSTYQALVPVYVSIAIMGYLLLCRRQMREGGEPLRHPCALPFQVFGIFLVAMAINTAVTQRWFSGGGYVENMILWKSMEASWCIQTVREYVIQGFTGRDSIFYSAAYGIFAVGAVACAAAEAVRGGRRAAGALYLLSAVTLQITPFLLGFLQGAHPAIRAQMAYPLVMAFDGLYLLDALGDRRAMCAAAGLAVCAAAFMQIQTTERLIYTDNVRSAQDVRALHAIMADVQRVSDTPKPLAFVGTLDAPLDPTCVKGEMIGASILNWDVLVEPKFMFSTNRIVEGIRVLGYPYERCRSEEDLLNARLLALEMPAYPQEGSVADAGSVIVVKLSEDPWAYRLQREEN